MNPRWTTPSTVEPSVGGADHDALPNGAARQKHRLDRAPVIAARHLAFARAGVDAWRATHLPAHHDQRFIVSPV